MSSNALAKHYDDLLLQEGLGVLEPGRQQPTPSNPKGPYLDFVLFPALYEHDDNGEEYSLEDAHSAAYRDPDSDHWIQPTFADCAIAEAYDGRTEALEALIPRLPAHWSHRHEFYRLWGQSGYVKKSAQALGIKLSTVHKWLTELRDHLCPDRKRKVNSNGKRRTATGGVSFYATRSHLHNPWVANPSGNYLGAFATQEEACAAVERWRLTNPRQRKRARDPI